MSDTYQPDEDEPEAPSEFDREGIQDLEEDEKRDEREREHG